LTQSIALLTGTIQKATFLPYWLTTFCALLAAQVFGSLDKADALLVFLTVVFQAVLTSHDRIQSRLFALQKIEAIAFRTGKKFIPDKSALALLASPAVILAGLLDALGYIWFMIVVTGYAQDAWRLTKDILKRKTSLSNLHAEYRRRPPSVVVHFSGMKGSAYQVNQWLPVLEQLECSTAIIVRKYHLIRDILPTALPIYYANGHLELDWLLGNGPKTVLYPANPMENAQALRQYHLHHYFINHGESDKAVNQSKMLLAYDKLLVGGALAERRLRAAGLPLRNGQVVHVGRPQAELLLQRQLEKPEHISRLLYAPTWEGFADNVNYSSVNELGLDLVRTLVASGRYEVAFKPHPYTGSKRATTRTDLKRMIEICESNGIRILSDTDSLHEAMNWSDLLITDISSVLNEYLFTCKPIVLCDAKALPAALLATEFPSSAAAYTLDRGREITDLLENIQQYDSLQAARDHVRQDSLGSRDPSAMERFAAVIQSSLEE
jgi:hypothetical protein